MAPQQKQQMIRAVVKNTFVDVVDETDLLDEEEAAKQRRVRAATCDVGTLLRDTEGKLHARKGAADESLLFTCTFGGNDSEPEGEPDGPRSGTSTPATSLEPSEPSVVGSSDSEAAATADSETMMMMTVNQQVMMMAQQQIMPAPPQQQPVLFCDTSSGAPVFYHACYVAQQDGGASAVYMVPVANQDQIVLVQGGSGADGQSQQPMALVQQQPEQPMMMQQQQVQQPMGMMQQQKHQQQHNPRHQLQQKQQQMFPSQQEQHQKPRPIQLHQVLPQRRPRGGEQQRPQQLQQEQQNQQPQPQQQPSRKEQAGEQRAEPEHQVPEHLRTTVMLRNLPNGYTSEMLRVLLDRLGFAAEYDFLYLPIDFRNGVNIGYAFVNMQNPASARRLRERIDGFNGWTIDSPKVCEVSWSHPQQGLAEHIERYRNSPVMHESMPMEYKPRLFRDGREVPFPPPTKPIKAVKLRKAFPLRDEEATIS